MKCYTLVHQSNHYMFHLVMLVNIDCFAEALGQEFLHEMVVA